MATFDRTYGTTSLQSAADSRLARKLHIDWSAVSGGTLLGWGALFLLSVIGGALGLAAIDPYALHPAAGLDLASDIWALLAMLATSFLGAFFVVRISGDRRRSESLLHGAISWGLSMLLGAILALFAAGAAANASQPPARQRTVATGNGTAAPALTRADRIRADEAKRDLARGAGLAGGGALLSLVAALFGALFAASRSSGISIAEEFRPRRGSKQPKSTLPKSSVIMPGERRDETTILPPTH